MSTEDERQDLMQNPLPVDLKPLQAVALIDYVKDCPADRVLTSIVLIDEQMERIQAALKPYLVNLAQQREQLLARAKVQGITDDSEAILIEKKGRHVRNEIEDLEAFELAFPTEYRQLREDQKKSLTDDYENKVANLAECKINLTAADSKIGKDRVTEFVGYKLQILTYEVIRKRKE